MGISDFTNTQQKVPRISLSSIDYPENDRKYCAHAYALARKLSMLPRDIRKLVNQRSHAAGVAYAEQTRQQLLNELENMRIKGATLADLESYISNRPPIFTTLIDQNVN